MAEQMRYCRGKRSKTGVLPDRLSEMNRRFLILTAGYGEGHNSAARALEAEGKSRGYECRVYDLCAETMPHAFRFTRKAYLEIIARLPWLWRALFDLADNVDLDGCPLGLGQIRDRMLELIAAWKPDAVLCTFPIYAPMLDEAKGRGVELPPCVVVVTDSLTVSRSWIAACPDRWLVTDETTRQILLDTYSLDPDRLTATGFPVSACFDEPSLSSWQEGSPFRVLYLPQASFSRVEQEMAALLSAHGDVRLTIVTGKKERLRSRLQQHFGASPDDRVSILGWVGDMHRLLASHHLYVGKAGGASVHECYAARLPAMINFFVPGQEEGNLQLLLDEGCGATAETPAEAGEMLRRLLQNGGARWRAGKAAMQAVGRGGGAARCWRQVEAILES